MIKESKRQEPNDLNILRLTGSYYVSANKSPTQWQIDDDGICDVNTSGSEGQRKCPEELIKESAFSMLALIKVNVFPDHTGIHMKTV